jgi:hypothetical protein
MAPDNEAMAPRSEGDPAGTPPAQPAPVKRWRPSGKAWVFLALVALPLLGLLWGRLTYPSDRTPQGAYLRIVTAVNRGRPEEFFAYTEETAQQEAYTIRDYRKKAMALIVASYPEAERTSWLERYQKYASAADGADVFGIYARERGWLDRLRRDMSGSVRVEEQGERATVVTARGTRYPFRRRPNGIWGTTLFTASLTSEAERAARDYLMIEKAAQDYQRAKPR